MKIDLSIIIVSYNTRDLTQNCIDSIVKHTHDISYEIIVVDNGSTDGSVDALKSLSLKIPASRLVSRRNGQGGQCSIRIIENKQNLGYAKANNVGIKNANGDAYLLLNSDTIIQEDAIDLAYAKLKKADILTINLKNEDMSNQQAAGFGPNLLNIFYWAFFIDDLPLLNRILKPYQISRLDFFEKDHEVDWVMGAFFMMKKKVVEKAGFLDENIFMYGEEMEFCKRAKNAGFKVMYFAFPFIIHLGQGSSQSSEGAILGEYKSLIYFFEKFYSKNVLKFVKATLFFSILLRSAIFLLIDKKKAKIYAKAFKVL